LKDKPPLTNDLTERKVRHKEKEMAKWIRSSTQGRKRRRKERRREGERRNKSLGERKEEGEKIKKK